MNDRSRPRRPLLLVALVMSLLWPGVTGVDHIRAGAQPVPPPAMLYLALGDSYASGQGLGDRGDCRRSDEGYPYYVRDGLPFPAGMRVLACGGTTARPNDTPSEDLMSQVGLARESMARAADRPTLVTVSAGINDFAVGDELLGRLADPERPYEEFTAWVDSVLPVTAGWLRLAVDELLVAPNARVVLVTYPNPVPWTAAQCEDDDCYRRANYVFDQLNAVIMAQADPALPGRDRVTVTTGLAERFRGHDCLAVLAGSWFQALGSLAENGLRLGELFGVDWSVGDCAHPNEAGAEVIAEEVLAAAAPLLAIPLVATTMGTDPLLTSMRMGDDRLGWHPDAWTYQVDGSRATSRDPRQEDESDDAW